MGYSIHDYELLLNGKEARTDAGKLCIYQLLYGDDQKKKAKGTYIPYMMFIKLFIEELIKKERIPTIPVVETVEACLMHNIQLNAKATTKEPMQIPCQLLDLIDKNSLVYKEFITEVERAAGRQVQTALAQSTPKVKEEPSNVVKPKTTIRKTTTRKKVKPTRFVYQQDEDEYDNLDVYFDTIANEGVTKFVNPDNLDKLNENDQSDPYGDNDEEGKDRKYGGGVKVQFMHSTENISTSDDPLIVIEPPPTTIIATRTTTPPPPPTPINVPTSAPT
ncbi:hypothetical protein Tco_0529009 [Tanacetum coccineum]